MSTPLILAIIQLAMREGMRRIQKLSTRILAPSADDVVTRGNLFQEQRNVVGIVLQIAVHGDDVLAAGMVESGGEARGLAEVAAQLDDGHTAVDGRDFAQHREGVIVGAVVHEHDFEGFAVRLHDRFQAVVEVGDVLLLVMQRDDDGVLGHSPFIIDRKAVLGSRFSVLSWVRRDRAGWAVAGKSRFLLVRCARALE